MAEFRLSEEEWVGIERLLPKQRMGRPRTRDKECFEAIVYVLKTGCQWDMLPSCYPPKSTVHRRFLVWHKAGLFRRLFKKTRSRPVRGALAHVNSTLRVTKRGRFGEPGRKIQNVQTDRVL